MAREMSVAAARRQLRKELRAVLGGESESAAARRVGWDPSKVNRILSGARQAQPDDVEQLLEAFGVDDAETIKRMKTLARRARERGWWQQPSSSVTPELWPLVEAITASHSIDWFELALIPGPLQTEDYARASIAAMVPDLDEDDVSRRAQARLEMQQALRGEDPPRLHIILDSSVLKREIGGRDVLVEQLRHLLEMAALPHITLRVVAKAGHPALTGWFSIMHMSSGALGYADGSWGTAWLEAPTDIRSLTLKFGMLQALSLKATDSIALVEQVIKELEGGDHDQA